MAKEKQEKKSLEDVMKELNKQYGAGSVIHGDQQEKFEEVISTGSFGLDSALGIGGIPKRGGKIYEIYGWESAGKSTIAQTIIGNFQKAGEKCLLVNGENSLDEQYSSALGISLQDLYVIQLDETAGEGAYNKMEKMVETGEIGLVIIDSYNSLKPLKIVSGEVGDASMGVHARMMDTVVGKANNLAIKHGTIFLFLGQIREKIGVMFGSPETTQGGNALRFYAHVRLKVSRSLTAENSIMNGKEKVGNKTTVKVEKNKLAPPFKSCSFDIIYGQGIDNKGEILELARDFEIIRKHGKKITYGEVNFELSDKDAIHEFYDFLDSNPELLEEIKQKVLDSIKNPKSEEIVEK